MASDIRLSVDLFTHHKTRKLKRKLGSDGVLALIALFCYAGKFRSDGTFKGMDAEDIAESSGWDGDSSEFVEALCEIGFLEKCEEGIYQIHEWEQHNSWAAGSEERKIAASKAGKASAESKRIAKNYNPSSTPINEALESVVMVANVNQTPSPSPSPSPEKEREKCGSGSSTILKRFVKPSPNDVDTYCRECGYSESVNGQRFCDYYDSKGWKVGRNGMQDWRAAVRTWVNQAKKHLAEKPDIFAGCL